MSPCITQTLYTTTEQPKVISHSRTKQLKVILIASLSFQFLSSIVYMSLAHPQKQCIPVHCQNNKTVHPARFGKYDELLQAGYDFEELAAAHDSSMQLVEIAAPTGDRELPLSRKPSNKTFIIVTNQSTLCTSYIHEIHVLFVSFFTIQRITQKSIIFHPRDFSYGFQHNLYKCTINMSFFLY